MDIRVGKGISSGESNEILRVLSERSKENVMSKSNYDPTREKLDFEVTRGGQIRPLDKTVGIRKRIRENLASRGIQDPNEGLKEPKFRTVVSIIFGGSTERMRELAFGDQVVNYDHDSSDNSAVKRMKEIEDWSRDIYNFVGGKFGEENIASFVVHLDESNPHVHCTLLPIKDGKFKYKEIFAGKDKFEFSQRMKDLHSQLAEVNRPWGLVRGTSIAETHARHRSSEEYRRSLTEECNSLENTISRQKSELEQIRADIRRALKAKKSLETMIANLQKKIEANNALIERFNEQMRAKIGDPERLKAECDRLKAENARLEESLADKRGKCQKAELELQGLTERMDSVKKWTRNVEQKGIEYADRILKVYDVDIRDAILDGLCGEIRYIMEPAKERGIDLDGSLMEGIGENGNRLIECTIDLFVGLTCDATTFAQSHGGGGTTNNNWGRKKDEDDRSWARRCARMAALYLKSSGQRVRMRR